MQNPDPEIIITIIAASMILLILVVFVVSFLFIYQKRYFRHQQELNELKQSYKQELLVAELEIKEDTFGHISREIHDNIGQMLSLIKLNLSLYKDDSRLIETKELTGAVISDLRNLAQSLDTEKILQQGLLDSIKREVDRLDKNRLFNINLTSTGDEYEMNKQHELFIFRIFQESLTNIFKHANATSIEIQLHFAPSLFSLLIRDNGKGFNTATVHKGLGINNMLKRAKLIGAEITFDSAVDKGCTTILNFNSQMLPSYVNENY